MVPAEHRKSVPAPRTSLAGGGPGAGAGRLPGSDADHGCSDPGPGPRSPASGREDEGGWGPEKAKLAFVDLVREASPRIKMCLLRAKLGYHIGAFKE